MGSNPHRFAESCVYMQHVLGEQKMESVIVVPYLFDGFLILSFDSNWMNVFGGMMSFRVFVDKSGRLNIISEESCLKQ